MSDIDGVHIRSGVGVAPLRFFGAIDVLVPALRFRFGLDKMEFWVILLVLSNASCRESGDCC